jgi:aspartate/methionine/tyrosine aminotransferase
LIKPAKRAQLIQPFYVMDLLAQAKTLEAQGRSIIHLEVGEPDFPTPDTIKQEAINAYQQDLTKYTAATGMPELREAISGFYADKFRFSVSPERIIVTPGASGALLLVLASLLNAGDDLLLTDPGYPCNRNFAYLLNVNPVGLPVEAGNDFLPTLDELNQAIEKNPNARTLMLASPSNPTGSVIRRDTLESLAAWAKQHNIALIVDEIYQGITFDTESYCAGSVDADIFIINSFSKYFCMSGWRLGWTVVPEGFVPVLDKLAQNIYLAAPTVAQIAALKAFDKDVIEILEQRRALYQERSEYLYQKLIELGFRIPHKPQGAFYLYADCSEFTQDSYDFCQRLLHEAGVAITPGRDFGDYKQKEYVRLTCANSMENIEQAVERIRDFIS